MDNKSIKIMGDFLSQLRVNETNSVRSHLDSARLQEQQAVVAYIDMITKLNKILASTKDAESFSGLLKVVSDLLDKEIFTPYDKIANNKSSEKKPKYDGPDIKMAMGFVGDIDDIPKEYIGKIAEVLKILGIPEEEVRKQLGLS